MNLQRTLSSLFSLICLSGFLFQVQQVSDLYFRFGTTTKTVFEIREIDHYQTMLYCPRSVDFFSKAFKNFGNVQNVTVVMERAEKELSKLTIKDILELTPPINHVIKQCAVRQGIMSIPVVLDQRDCEAFFHVSKSVIGERVCYTIMPKIGANFSVGAVASSRLYTNIVYTIYVKPVILETKLAAFLSWIANEEQGNDPFDSCPYQARVFNYKTLTQSSFVVYGESIKIHRLPPPFDTKCTPGHQREKCYEQCLNKQFAVINRVSWSGFHREKLNMNMVTANDLRNDSISEFINGVFVECQTSCKTHADCVTQFSRTSVQEFQSPNQSSFSSMLPSFPRISLHAVPSLNLIEYVVQVGSSFGIWFGLSIISLNPMKVLQPSDSASRLVNNRNRRLLFILSKLVRQNGVQNH